jgi:hypothetical protein
LALGVTVKLEMAEPPGMTDGGVTGGTDKLK